MTPALRWVRRAVYQFTNESIPLQYQKMLLYPTSVRNVDPLLYTSSVQSNDHLIQVVLRAAQLPA